MVIEHVHMAPIEKPWGSKNLGQWRANDTGSPPIGELWFERPAKQATAPSLLLKLLFTSQPLSIQVHPNDAYAHSLGLKTGKTEAWYILSAEPGAKVALGLTQTLTASKLRDAIIDGSIAALVKWREVAKDDVIFVPAGTIHALSAGLVVAEIQQRSDTTFRLFDFGRGRRLDVDHAVAAAFAAPATHQITPSRLDDVRSLLLSSQYFTLELIDLPPSSHWEFTAETETWILALQGAAQFGETSVKAGEAIFMQMQAAPLSAGAKGFKSLVAYAAARPSRDLLRSVDTNNNNADEHAFLLQASAHDTLNSWVRSTGVAQ
jgi:mannose-6-phosphate isomerase